MLFSWFFLLLLSFSAQADSNSECNGSDIVHLQRPIDPTHPEVGSFDYSYRFLKKAQPGKPTLIFLPGGPGDTSIDTKFFEDSPATVPADFGLIRTDPRGVGCNQVVPSLAQKFLSTEILATDIVAIIQSTGLQHYQLHGISYGTELATMVASQAEKAGLPRADAIILEGVLGRAFHPGEVFEGFLNSWSQIKSMLSAGVRDSLLKESSPLGIDSETWGLAIPTLLLFGQGMDHQNMAVQLFSSLDPNSPAQKKSELEQTIRGIAEEFNNPPIEKQRLYQQIVCHELASEVYSSLADVHFDLVHGDLVAKPGQLCDGITLDQPFDAGNWKTTSPIYYFEGSMDPSTPMQQARAHFDSQTQSERTFVTVIQGAHMALSYNLADCKSALLKEISLGGAQLETALKSCQLSTELIRAK